jgi:hypothetical protein
MHIAPTSCCGLREISGLSYHNTPGEAMREFALGATRLNYVRSGRVLVCSHVIFSAADGANDYGDKFAAYIRRHKLGTIAISRRLTNPNSGNPLKVWVWSINKTALLAWARKHIK